MRVGIALAITLALAPLSARADDMASMPGMKHDAPAAPGTEPESTTAFRRAMTRMHEDMDIPYTGNADRDFVQGMIPHHQGAIDMARIELRFGTDPKLKRLAKDIVAAQAKEIALMRAWLDDHPH
jgi:uncharacterized protein (DUF305 family)